MISFVIVPTLFVIHSLTYLSKLQRSSSLETRLRGGFQDHDHSHGSAGQLGSQVINLLRLKDILEKILDNMRFKDIKYSFQTDG